ncbi:hypothetical protein BaRGS_00005702 [Batillaria attramentaria]|uniref:Uncharacterized protein n=1 Tax=Batillaria attramentaria TaxID=370345 RepID=A0ABD0LV94_9CAEN
MPSFTNTSSDYVQWQSARRQAAQAARDTAIDIIEHYNRVTLHDDDENQHYSRYDNHATFSVNSSIVDPAAGDGGSSTERGKGKMRTPRSKKSGPLRVEYLARQGTVFTEGISSLSRRSNFPLSLKRNDVLRQNLPDTVKLGREKSRVYFALNQSGSTHGKQHLTNQGDLSAKSTKTLPPPSSSFPWSDVLAVTEMKRSKTFHLDVPLSDRAGLSTRSTLDSRGTAVTDIQPVRQQHRPGGVRYLRYPSSTGAPPSTPMTSDYFGPRNTPHMFGAERKLLRPSKPSVSIVSFGGDTVADGVKRSDFRPRLPVPFKGLSHDLALQGKGNVGTMTNDISRSSSKPGIDLPQLPLRAADAKDVTFPHTSRGRPSRMNYNAQASSRRSRRRFPAGYSRHAVSDRNGNDGVREDNKETSFADDPYADRFRQASSVSSLCEVYIPLPPPASASSRHQDSDTDDEHAGLPEPSIMLTVQEEEEGGDKESPPRSKLSEGGSGYGEGDNNSPRGLESDKSGSRSNRSLLSVPTLNACLDLSEARPPSLLPDVSGEVSLTIEVPLPETRPGPPHTHTPPPPPSHGSGRASGEGGHNIDLHDSPEAIASTSVLNTARTIATQTSIPYDPDAVDDRPKVVKVKTLSMFPDIIPPASPPGLYLSQETEPHREGPTSTASSDPLLRGRVGNKHSGMSKPTLLPELQKDVKQQAVTSSPGGDDSVEDEVRLKSGKSNSVTNITFISPLEIQQNAKRC